MTVELSCQYCGRRYRVIPSRTKTSKYCSIKCYYKAKRGKTAWNKGCRKLQCSKTDLERLYWKEKKSLKKIGALYHVDAMTVFRRMCDYNIKRRTHSEIMRANSPMKNPLIAKKMGQTRREKIRRGEITYTHLINRGKNVDYSFLKRLHDNPEIQKKRFRAIHKRPNKAENKLISLITENGLPFRYVGNGELIICRKNPDFIHYWKPKIIELFGRYWHSGTNRSYATEDGRKAFFKSVGYDTLVIWDDEINNRIGLERTLQKIKVFEGGD